jgi:hypothetical protein
MPAAKSTIVSKHVRGGKSKIEEKARIRAGLVCVGTLARA